MSLILDALRRSEGGGVAPNSRPDLLAEHSGGVGRKWLAGVVLVCVVLGIAVGWLMRSGLRDAMQEEQVFAPVARSPSLKHSGAALEPPRVVDMAALPRDEVSASVSDVTGADLSEQTPLSSIAASEENAAERESIAALHQQMWTDAATTVRAEGQGPDRNDALISADEKTGSPATASPRTPSAAASIAPPIDLVAAIERAAREVGEPSLVPHPTVLLENLSQQQKDQIPTIVYTGHAYAESAVPTVELNGKRLRPGQRVGSVTVEDILVDSAILRVNGVSFRLRALNTWVNL